MMKKTIAFLCVFLVLFSFLLNIAVVGVSAIVCLTHSYALGVCTACGYACPHTNTSWLHDNVYKCNDCTIEITKCNEHTFSDATCTVCGYVCDHSGKTEWGDNNTYHMYDAWYGCFRCGHQWQVGVCSHAMQTRYYYFVELTADGVPIHDIYIDCNDCDFYELETSGSVCSFINNAPFCDNSCGYVCDHSGLVFGYDATHQIDDFTYECLRCGYEWTVDCIHPGAYISTTQTPSGVHSHISTTTCLLCGDVVDEYTEDCVYYGGVCSCGASCLHGSYNFIYSPITNSQHSVQKQCSFCSALVAAEEKAPCEFADERCSLCGNVALNGTGIFKDSTARLHIFYYEIDHISSQTFHLKSCDFVYNSNGDILLFETLKKYIDIELDLEHVDFEIHFHSYPVDIHNGMFGASYGPLFDDVLGNGYPLVHNGYGYRGTKDNGCPVYISTLSASFYADTIYSDELSDFTLRYIHIPPVSDATMYDLYGGIFDSMQNTFYSMLNFDILGFNIASLVLGFMTLAILIVVLKKVV